MIGLVSALIGCEVILNQGIGNRLFRPAPGAWFRKNNYSSSNSLISLTFALPKLIFMARVCQVTGKTPVGGHKVSHSNIKTKRRFLPNLQTKKFYLADEDKWVTLKVSADAIRTINKNGLYSVVKQLRAQGEKI